jgi:hypothetical protein
MIFVLKKDGTQRLCMDYRALNEVTIKNKYRCLGLMIYSINSMVCVCVLQDRSLIRVSSPEDSRVRHTEDCIHFEVWSIRVYGDVIWVN